jgi:transposase
MAKFVVKLTDDERSWLQRLVSSGKGAARKLLHGRILLLADAGLGPGKTDEEIGDALNVSRSTIFRVRQRFVEESFEAALQPRSLPCRPSKVKIPDDAEKQLIALVCGDPPSGRCRWTLHLLAEHLVKLGHVNSVSHETVRQALKKMTSNPGKSRRGAFRPSPVQNLSTTWKTC